MIGERITTLDGVWECISSNKYVYLRGKDNNYYYCGCKMFKTMPIKALYQHMKEGRIYQYIKDE